MISTYSYFLVFCGFLAVHKCTAIDNVNFKTTQREDVPAQRIERWLKIPIQDIPYLNLMLRSTDYRQDIENPYTQWFLKQTLVPFTLSSYEVLNNITAQNMGTRDRDNYVIATNFQDLRRTAQYFALRSGIYFFVVSDEVNLQELRDICHMLWTSFQIYKSLLLTSKGVLIYDPFAINESGEYGKMIAYTGELSIERTLFYNLRGYPLRVQIFKSVYSKPKFDPITKKVKYIYGVDGRVADVIQQHMNFTMNLLDPDPDYFGERAPNGSYNGAIGSIIDNELDLCLSGFFVKDYMVPEMEFSVAVYDDKLCIYAPKAKRIPESILPILSVGYDLWLGFILTAFVCSFIWAILRCINLRLNNTYKNGTAAGRGSGSGGGGGKLDKSFKWQYIRILIDTWVVWVRVNVTHLPPFSSEKIFIASLCLVSVIFGAIFESSLATVYIHPMYYSDIHTMEDLDKSGLLVIYKYTSMGDDLFFSETSPLFANLNKKLRHLKDLNADVMGDVAINGGKAGVTRYTTLMLEAQTFIVSKQVWIVPECPKYYTISYVWPKNSPWDDTVNQLLLRMLTAGLFNKFIADMQTDVDIKTGRQLTATGGGGFKVLTIEDLQLAFYVIVIGSLLALISLMVERRKGHRLTTVNTQGSSVTFLNKSKHVTPVITGKG